ncbi:MAG: S8 family peptidase [Luteimonas sp.]
MSENPKSPVRIHALAAATAVALTALVAGTVSAAERLDLSGLQASQQYDRFIVKYRDGSAERADPVLLTSALRSAATAVSSAQGGKLDVQSLRRMTLGADVIKSSRKLNSAEAESLMRQIAVDPNVEYVELDKLNQATLIPNDTRFSEQYGLGTGAGGIRATEAWDTTSGAGSVVAVLDTGITSHSDLNANILPGYDFIIDTAVSVDGNGRDSNPNDPGDASGGAASSWHGTHVAGTVAALTNNALGVAGVAYGARVVPVRVLGRGGGYDSDIADAIIWASGGTVSGVPANANPAEAINLSLGGAGACGATMQSAINGAVGRGTTLVIAAGNGNANVSGSSPANCANVIAVGAVTSTGARASYSNYGAGIDVAAPGSAVLSTLNSGTTTPGAESYASYNGTSMSTPHVAGTVALMQSVATTPLTPAQVEATLRSSARAFPATPSQPIGSGIINARAAIDAVIGGGGGGGTTQTYSNATDYTISDNATVNSPITVSGRTGNAPSNASVAVNIVHTYRGDLRVDLVAPDGSLYLLSNRTGADTDNINTTYTVNLSSEALNGTWNLRVNDNGPGDVGYINSWSLTF